MASGSSIAKLCRARILQYREEVRNGLRDKLAALEKAAQPLAHDDAQSQRPFMLPLGHDPYDIWNHIIHHAKDPKGVLSLWEACPLFREMMCCKRKYVQAKLPQIVQLILEKRPKLLLENFGGQVNGGRVSPSLQILLNLRLISRLCKNSAEELLYQASGRFGRKISLCLVTISDVRNVIDSILGKEIGPENFFPQRVIVFACSFHNVDVHRRAEFDEAVGIFLELVGRRVKSFSFIDIGTLRRIYDKLREWVLYMPKLEDLELFTSWTHIAKAGDIPAFPNCPQLRSFNLSWNILPKPYLMHVLKANPHIKVLSLPQGRSVMRWPESSEVLSTLQQLECLHIRPYASLLSQLEFQLPLKEIIFLDRAYNDMKVSSSKLFVFLHQFGDSLEHLELQASVKETGEYFLDLPNLKFFKWKYNTSFKDLHFLLHAEHLEEVQMVVRQQLPNTNAFFNNFLENVTFGFDGLSLWKVFPRLKRFSADFIWQGQTHAICKQ